MIDKNEIKKILYKEKPIANRIAKVDGGYIYSTETSIGEVKFIIPYKEMGMTPFDQEMSAQLLIRWLDYDGK